MRFIARADHDLDPVDAGGGREAGRGGGRDGRARQKGILLGEGAAEAAPPPASHDQGGTSRHEGLNNIGLGGAHFGPLHATPGPAIARSIIVHCTRCLFTDQKTWTAHLASSPSISARSPSRTPSSCPRCRPSPTPLPSHC